VREMSEKRREAHTMMKSTTGREQLVEENGYP